VSKEDYRIVIESTNCTVEKLTANEIDFRPPIRKPDVDERFRYNNVSTLQCHQSGSLHVQVTVRFHSLTQHTYDQQRRMYFDSELNPNDGVHCPSTKFVEQ